MNNEITKCEEVRPENISDVIRQNSCVISSIFGMAAGISNHIAGVSAERDVKANEPDCMMRELLWQRSMLERVTEELEAISRYLGA